MAIAERGPSGRRENLLVKAARVVDHAKYRVTAGLAGIGLLVYAATSACEGQIPNPFDTNDGQNPIPPATKPATQTGAVTSVISVTPGVTETGAATPTATQTETPQPTETQTTPTPTEVSKETLDLDSSWRQIISRTEKLFKILDEGNEESVKSLVNWQVPEDLLPAQYGTDYQAKDSDYAIATEDDFLACADEIKGHQITNLKFQRLKYDDHKRPFHLGVDIFFDGRKSGIDKSFYWQAIEGNLYLAKNPCAGFAEEWRQQTTAN